MPSAKATACNHSFTLWETSFQESPPSTVRRMVPPDPTATPCFSSEKRTSSSHACVLEGRRRQISPPFSVHRIVPRAPTAHPIFCEMKHTPSSSSVTSLRPGAQSCRKDGSSSSGHRTGWREFFRARRRPSPGSRRERKCRTDHRGRLRSTVASQCRHRRCVLPTHHRRPPNPCFHPQRKL